MLVLKLVFLSSCLYLITASESSEELESWLSSPTGADVLRSAVKRIYNEDKQATISSLVDLQQSNDLNVTLVARQNIYGTNGDIIEIRTIELHIPKIATKSSNNEDDDDDDDDDNDEDIYKKLAELRKVFRLTSKLGFPMEVTAVEYTKTGETNTSAYINENLLYGFTEGINIVNKTIEVNNIQTVNDHIKELQEKGIPVAVHRFDANNQFLIEESKIIPEYVVSVLSEEGDVDQQMLDEAQKGLATISLKYQNNRDEVPSKLSEFLNLKYPQFDFNVFLEEPEAWYVNKDYKINIRYDLGQWDSLEELNYSIFVVNKTDLSINNETIAELPTA